MKYYNMSATEKGMRFMSGMFVMDERMVFGRPVIGYLNAAGQVWNELHLDNAKYHTVGSNLEQKMSLQSFQLSVNGEQLADNWVLGEREISASTATMELFHKSAPVKVELVTGANGNNWLTRSLRITNTGKQPITIDKAEPLSGTPWLHRLNHDVLHYSIQEISENPAQPAFELGYNVENQFLHEGDFRFVPISENPLMIDSGMHGRSGWTRPAIILKNNLNGSLFCAELAYSGNWHARVEANLDPSNTFINFEMGMCCPDGQVLCVLSPGETIETPELHFTLCASGFEALMQSRHSYVRECIMPETDPMGCCMVEANHRGYLSDRENEKDILADVELAAQAGAEVYVIDAGWYGREPNIWYDNVGDWHAGAWLENDLYPIIDKVHEKGMKFGLWMELEAVGYNSALKQEHPDWIMQSETECPANGRALDISKTEVADWVYGQAESLISKYHLDMFRIDHNHRIGNGLCVHVGPYHENNLWKYYKNLYAIFEKLRNKFPNVSFQNCAAGGGRLDFGILRYFNHSELSDWMHAPRVHRIFRGTMLQLPPESLLQCFGTEVEEQVMKGDIIFQLHSVLGSRFILRGIAPTEETRNRELHQQICRIVALYKEKLRPVLCGNCLVYQHTNSTNGILSPDSWLVYEFALPSKTVGYSLVFRLGDHGNQTYTFRPKGIQLDKQYRVTLDRTQTNLSVSGYPFREIGITIFAEQHFSSELIYWEAVDEN